MIRLCNEEDFDEIWTIVNDGASAYRGIIPADRWSEPYMTQEVLDVTLIRHAYVRTTKRRSGLGGRLLRYLQALTERRILIGTWADASWAIKFYEKNGFQLVAAEEKDQLLRRYWNIPVRQVETSVVLSSEGYLTQQITG